MYFYTYKTINNINGNFYIGVHKTSRLDDGYLGSGSVLKRALKKYGRENFTKHILAYHNSQEEMYAHEKELVNEILINRPDVYNVKLGGQGGFDHVKSTNSAALIRARNIKASAIFQEKLKDPEFYNSWHAKMMAGRNRAKQNRGL